MIFADAGQRCWRDLQGTKYRLILPTQRKQ